MNLKDQAFIAGQDRQILKRIAEGQYRPNLIGCWDKAGRFYIYAEYHTESSRAIRSPSRAWPYSEYKHALTAKYRKQLLALITSRLATACQSVDATI